MNLSLQKLGHNPSDLVGKGTTQMPQTEDLLINAFYVWISIVGGRCAYYIQTSIPIMAGGRYPRIKIDA